MRSNQPLKIIRGLKKAAERLSKISKELQSFRTHLKIFKGLKIGSTGIKSFS